MNSQSINKKKLYVLCYMDSIYIRLSSVVVGKGSIKKRTENKESLFL